MSEIIKNTLKKLSVNPTNEALLDFVHWIDLEYCQTSDSKNQEIINQIITRAIIAMGHYIIENAKLNSAQSANINKTLIAASEYAVFPSQQNLDNYFFEATNSYPFGKGEGCYSVKSLVKDKPCGIGTGCRSGAGSLCSNGVDNKVVFSLLKENLLPWLSNEGDPVLKTACD